MSEFRSSLWIQGDDEYLFPEQHDPGVDLAAGNSAVCFSGGGTRAMCAAMGQMRALRRLGLFPHTRYISSVSGGTWASALFTYYRSGDGRPAGDDEFLGPVTPPERISEESLGDLPSTRLGSLATGSLLKDILALLGHDPQPRLWLDGVGRDFFEPFGLFDSKKPAYFSFDEASVARIRAANPALADAVFHTVRTQEKRPFLVMNSCIVGPTELAPFVDEQLVHFEYTPLYAGSPHALVVHYTGKRGGSLDLPLGGGYVEPFALGGEAPTAPPANCDPSAAPQRCKTLVPAPPRPFSLADAAGTSSSAVAASFEENPFLDHLGAQLDYWPVGSGKPVAARTFDFGDGGSLENYGLLAMLRRRVENLVVFINTPTPLDLDYDPSGPPKEHQIDGNLGPLFGFAAGMKKHNQVFSGDDWPSVAGALQAARRAGEAAVVVREHEIQANEWWGIPGGWRARICWVYLERVSHWEKRLDRGLRHEINKGRSRFWPHGDFKHFPNYKTIGENPLELVEFTPQQVNLLADLTCSVVLDNRQHFERLLAG